MVWEVQYKADEEALEKGTLFCIIYLFIQKKEERKKERYKKRKKNLFVSFYYIFRLCVNLLRELLRAGLCRAQQPTGEAPKPE